MSLPPPDSLFQKTRQPPGAIRTAPARDVAFPRRIERQRRLLQRAFPAGITFPLDLLARITCCSCRLENLSITERDAAEALACGAGRRAFRTPQLLRIRNHVAILRHIQKDTRRSHELNLPAVVRWYTSVSCGLSMSVDLGRIERLEQCLRRINAPQLRLQQAIADIAQVHTHLTADPIFPGFNGILARLLLQYHLARCRLPFVLFDPHDAQPDSPFELSLMQMISTAYDALLRI